MDGEQQAGARAGMVISVRTREDVVVTDPVRFVNAARRAYLAQNPDASTQEAAAAVADVYDAVDALVDCYGCVASDDPDVAGEASPRRRMAGGVGLLPGDRVLDRPDGLSPAGTIRVILLDDGLPLQDYGCFLPDEDQLFARRPHSASA
jgi:hypothetical protein